MEMEITAPPDDAVSSGRAGYRDWRSPMAETETMKDNMKKAAKAAAPKFEAPKFDPTKVQVPEVFREMAEKSVEQAKEALPSRQY